MSELLGHFANLRRFAFKYSGGGDSPMERYAESADVVCDAYEKLERDNAALLAAAKAIITAKSPDDWDEAIQMTDEAIFQAESQQPQSNVLEAKRECD